ISLHNFKDGYCGIINVEDGKTNLCYLTHRDNVKRFKNIPDMEQSVLYKNPFLKSIFTESEFLFEKPEVINEISFETKSPIENHMLMSGDAAGMITPLCGNGMAIAIHSAKILSELATSFCKAKITRTEMENAYKANWTSQFAIRLWAGRKIQNLFGDEWSSNFAVNLARHAKPVANYLVSQTHGNPF
ncbi:MAG TPA: FAD-dependent oxidoreductase, partial [Cyclobacteriaceae bacterium]